MRSSRGWICLTFTELEEDDEDWLGNVHRDPVKTLGWREAEGERNRGLSFCSLMKGSLSVNININALSLLIFHVLLELLFTI